MNPPCISRQSLSLFSSPYHYKYHPTLHFEPTLSIKNSTTIQLLLYTYIIVFHLILLLLLLLLLFILSWLIITSTSRPASGFTLPTKNSSSISSTARPPSCPAILTSSPISISIPMIPGNLTVIFIYVARHPFLLLTFFYLLLPHMIRLPTGKALSEGNQRYYFSRRTQNRNTNNGYWKALGIDEPIISSSGKRVGMKRFLVFYLGEAPSGIKSSWIMQEYRLTDSGSSSTSGRSSSKRRGHTKIVNTICPTFLFFSFLLCF